VERAVGEEEESVMRSGTYLPGTGCLAGWVGRVCRFVWRRRLQVIGRQVAGCGDRYGGPGREEQNTNGDTEDGRDGCLGFLIPADGKEINICVYI
jgi:hypothetical protein